MGNKRFVNNSSYNLYVDFLFHLLSGRVDPRMSDRVVSSGNTFNDLVGGDRRRLGLDPFNILW